jgi:putative addiction module component (TIGR02574 family)
LEEIKAIAAEVGLDPGLIERARQAPADLSPRYLLWELETMTKQALLDEILRLPVEERIELLGEVCDQLAADSVPVPKWHLRELERRLAEPNPTYVPWSQVRAQLGLEKGD